MGKKNKRRQRNVAGAGSSGIAGKTKLTAPTSGLEDVYFMWGTAKDAAKFKDTVRKLTWHVGTCPWTQSLVASKSMSTLVTSEFEEPAVPAGEYWADPGSTVKTNNRTRPGTGDEVADSPPVTEDWKHNLEGEEYKTKRKVYNDQVLAWRENKTKCYHLVLSHCPRALEHQLKNSSKWEETEGNLDVVALRLLPLRRILELVFQRPRAVWDKIR